MPNIKQYLDKIREKTGKRTKREKNAEGQVRRRKNPGRKIQAEESKKPGLSKKARTVIAVTVFALIVGLGGFAWYFYFSPGEGNARDFGGFGQEMAGGATYVSASGTTSLGFTMDEFEPDYIETELYIEEVYLRSGDEVEAGMPVLKISQESIEEARSELEEAQAEASLAYRAGVITYEQSKINAKYTYDVAVLTGAQAEAVYNSDLKSAEETLETAQEAVTEAEEKIEEYSNANSVYAAEYKLSELAEQYHTYEEVYNQLLSDWGISDGEVGSTGMTGVSAKSSGSAFWISLSSTVSGNTENSASLISEQESATQSDTNDSEGSSSSDNNSSGGSGSENTTDDGNSSSNDNSNDNSNSNGENNNNNNSDSAEGDNNNDSEEDDSNDNEGNNDVDANDTTSDEDTSDDVSSGVAVAAEESEEDTDDTDKSEDSQSGSSSQDSQYGEKIIVLQQLKSNMQSAGNSYYSAYQQFESAVEKADIQLKQVNAQIDSLRADLAEAQTDYELAKLAAETTYKKSLAQLELAQSDYDAAMQKAEDELEALQDAHTEAKENQEEFEQLIGDGYFYTSSAGTVMMVGYAAEANLQAESMVVAYRNAEDISITASVSQEDISKLSVGDTAQVTIEGYGTFEGKITYLNPVSTSDSRTNITYQVIVSLEGEDARKLTENLTATVVFATDV